MDPLTASPLRYVLDACVMVDMLGSQRPRHSQARDLADLLTSRDMACCAPATVLIEIQTAASQELKANNAPMTPGRADLDIWPFDFWTIPIDQQFIVDYVYPFKSIPSLDMPRGGDLPYLYIAMMHRIPLVTEDIPLRNLAERWAAFGLPIRAISMEECLEELR
ncbi:MAG: hypothetical protein JWM95_1413 [Gemmatimonadetes bacterium]|nr:hypothetical protein [Gemmatimonadota bacterium]